MLRIYPVALEMLKDVRLATEQIALVDKDLARQLRRASMSVVLNIAEGTGASGGSRRARYRDALGSACETFAGLEAAEALGYVTGAGQPARRRFDHIIGTLVKLVR